MRFPRDQVGMGSRAFSCAEHRAAPFKKKKKNRKEKQSKKKKKSDFNHFTASFDLLLLFFSPLQMFTFPAAVLSGTGTCPFCPLSLLVVKKRNKGGVLTSECQAVLAGAFTFLPPLVFIAALK